MDDKKRPTKKVPAARPERFYESDPEDQFTVVKKDDKKEDKDK